MSTNAGGWQAYSGTLAGSGADNLGNNYYLLTFGTSKIIDFNVAVVSQNVDSFCHTALGLWDGTGNLYDETSAGCNRIAMVFTDTIAWAVCSNRSGVTAVPVGGFTFTNSTGGVYTWNVIDVVWTPGVSAVFSINGTVAATITTKSTDGCNTAAINNSVFTYFGCAAHINAAGREAQLIFSEPTLTQSR